jgi:hypothetical protein
MVLSASVYIIYYARGFNNFVLNKRSSALESSGVRTAMVLRRQFRDPFPSAALISVDRGGVRFTDRQAGSRRVRQPSGIDGAPRRSRP